MKTYSIKYPKSTLKRARHLRRNMTKAETKLWSLLRGNNLGARFRRQVPLGPYVLDFACAKLKLAIELDGSQHFTQRGIQSDSKRERYLSECGFTTLRFTDRDVFTNTEGVLETIYRKVIEKKKELTTH